MCAPVADYAMVTSSEQFQHNRAAVSMTLAKGAEFRVPGFLLGDRDTQGKVHHRPPCKGEHTRAVLAEYGFGPDEIEALIAEQCAIQATTQDH